MGDEPDFGGYVTKAGLRCSDGRVIKAEAFQHMDGQTVPLVWHHGHKDAKNVLGKVLLQARPDGVYGYGFFNASEGAQHTRHSVEHGDITALSIWANKLTEHNLVVSHGAIKEVSLVLSGANPGAKIDHVKIQHSDDPGDEFELDDEAIISHMGEVELFVEEEEETVEDETVEHAADEDVRVLDIYNNMSEEEKNVLTYMVGLALEEAAGSDGGDAEHSDTNNAGGELAHQEGSTDMTTRNLFEQNELSGDGVGKSHAISHDDMKAVFEDGKKRGSFKEAIHAYLDEHHLEHGINSIELLFPDAKNLTDTPQFDMRRTAWVKDVLASTRKTPFAKIKTLIADLTQDAARAKGYIKGAYKLEEWFGLTKRTTSPTTIYKKQKLDRDDIVDITDFNVVDWMMGEMRIMLEEELARAILIGDGRQVGDADKIKDPLGVSDGTGIRSILNDHELFVTTLVVNVDDANSSYEEVVDVVMDGMEYYKGTGDATFYTTIPELNKFKKAKDGNGRRYYENNAQVAEALGVGRIVTVEPFKEVAGLIGIIVNLADYNLGTNKGGEITSFEQFDIDYNQEKYLLETRLSGALVSPKTALVVKRTAASTDVKATPAKPSFNKTTGVITIPTTTGVVYKDSDGTTTVTAGALTAIAAGASKTIYSLPASGYFFQDTVTDSWVFTRDAA